MSCFSGSVFLKAEIMYIALFIINHLLAPDPPVCLFFHLSIGDNTTYLASHTRSLCPSHELITVKVLCTLQRALQMEGIRKITTITSSALHLTTYVFEQSYRCRQFLKTKIVHCPTGAPLSGFNIWIFFPDVKKDRFRIGLV